MNTLTLSFSQTGQYWGQVIFDRISKRNHDVSLFNAYNYSLLPRHNVRKKKKNIDKALALW